MAGLQRTTAEILRQILAPIGTDLVGLLTVAIPYGSTELCPIRALRRWQDAAGITEGAVFRRIWTPPCGRDGRNPPCPALAAWRSTPAPPPASSRPALPTPVSIPPRLAAVA
jgi:hypothetical protein